MANHDIRPILASETRPLRQAILRPHQRADELVYRGDDDADTLHAGAFHQGLLVGVATVSCNPCPRADFPLPWQLEGMATTPEVRGLGYGRALIAACLAHIAAHGGATIWCNGRTSAAGFYTTLGFQPVGAEFTTQTGPHYVFWRAVDR
ncbi:MAG: GNAT family N-acetyltransferase [Chloroflexales bacterium]|nr:GNAT family N-acetyltransferase [Chloroflexales bacterium]